MQNIKKRDRMIDFMKIGAIISVVLLHTSALFVNPVLKTPVILISVFRFGVPVFLMITGYLYLNLDIDFKLKNKLAALVKTLILSTLLFAIPPILGTVLQHKPFHLLPVISFGYHLWYLNLLVMVFLALPILKQINKSDQVMRYLTGLVIILGLIVPELVYLIHRPELGFYLQKFHFDFFRNMLILVLLGKYLFKLINNKIVVTGGFLATFYLVVYTLHLNPNFTDYAKVHYFANLNVVLILSCLFMLKLLALIYQGLKGSRRFQRFIALFSPHFLRIYIFHVIPMYAGFVGLKKLHLLARTELGSLVQIICITVLAIGISTLVSILLNQTSQTKRLFSLAN